MIIDWQMLCLKLQNQYKPLSVVAKEVGCNWQHLCRMSRGEVEQPRFNTGMALIDLAHDVLKHDDFIKLRLR